MKKQVKKGESVRIYPKDKIVISKAYGSLQKFIDKMIENLKKEMLKKKGK